MNDDKKNQDTQELLDGRESTYGNVVDNAQRVANIWNGYLGTDIITPADMMMMMALYKAYRFKVTPEYSDNINDVLGYAEIVRQVQEQTGGLIHAETVKEFKEKKARQGVEPEIQAYGNLVSEGDLERLNKTLHEVHPTVKDQIAHDIASQAQAEFHDDYDLNRKVRFPAPQTLDEIIEEQEHRAAEEEIKEGRRPPHLRLMPIEPTPEVLNMEAWLRNRCGLPIGDGKLRCRMHVGHDGECNP